MANEPAYRFIQVGGKTFYFNINQTHKGSVDYLTIIARKGRDASSDEKMTMFPNQVGAFMHAMLETYAELCRRADIGSPFQAAKGPIGPTGAAVPDIEVPSEERFRCPQCDTKVYDADDEYVGSLHIHSLGEGEAKVAVKCKMCGWYPDGGTVNETNGAVFYKSSVEGDKWAKLATY